MKLKYLMPRLYEDLFSPQLLSLEIEETKATCDDCAMAKPKNRGVKTYQKDLKCCTFYPFMPNYLIGNILSDKNADPSLKADLKKIIDKRRYSLPLGFVAPVKYQVEFLAKAKSDFGNRADLLCPYYDQTKNNCRVWKSRSAVCTTFYCKSSYGKAGLQFWSELSEYLTYVEMALLEEALVYLDFSPRQISDQLMYINRAKESSDLKKYEITQWSLPEKKARELWNGYYDEQEVFFKKTLEIVSKFDRKSFDEALGPMGEKLFNNVMKSRKAALEYFKSN